MKKLVRVLLVATIAIFASCVLVKKAVVHWYFFPRGDFALAEAPAEPDYSQAGNWAALPDREDHADVVPPNSGATDQQAAAEVDVFFLYPTTYLIGSDWNAATDNGFTNWITDRGIMRQQASAFNGAAKVYAPRYRQVSLGGQIQSEKPEQKEQALAVAYGDTERAFDYYLEHYNQGRPFFIASHSQGTTHAKELVKYLFDRYPEASQRLIAAYLVGNTVPASELSSVLDVCADAEQTGCFLSWNAMVTGGDPSHWQEKGTPLCVNPLSWKYDSGAMPAESNLGAIPITGQTFLKAPHKHLTGARCEDGMLWIDEPQQRGYGMAVFPGGSYHAYDYNLFYMSIRENVKARTEAFLRVH